MTGNAATRGQVAVLDRPHASWRGSYDNAYRVEAYSDIETVDQGEWDSLVDRDDIQASHEFVAVCQRSKVENASYRHLLVYRCGRLEAFGTLCRMSVSLDLLSPRIVRAVCGRARRAFPSFLRVPVVFCGLPVSFASSCLRMRAGSDPSAIAGLVAGQAEAWAAESNTPVICFKEFTTRETETLAGLEAHGLFRAHSLPSCSLPIVWNSFEEYANTMRSGYRRQLRATLRARDTENLELRLVEDFSHECPQIFALYGQVMDRAPYQLERLNLSFFERLNEDLGTSSRALLVERHGELLAAAVLLYTPGTLTFLLAGIDYDRAQAHHAYPNLVVEVVSEAILRRVRVLELGQTSYALKQRLGARTASRTLFLRYRPRIARLLLESASGVLFPQTSLQHRHVFREP